MPGTVRFLIKISLFFHLLFSITYLVNATDMYMHIALKSPETLPFSGPWHRENSMGSSRNRTEASNW